MIYPATVYGPVEPITGYDGASALHLPSHSEHTAPSGLAKLGLNYAGIMPASISLTMSREVTVGLTTYTETIDIAGDFRIGWITSSGGPLGPPGLDVPGGISASQGYAFLVEGEREANGNTFPVQARAFLGHPFTAIALSLGSGIQINPSWIYTQAGWQRQDVTNWVIGHFSPGEIVRHW
jgi:hypothetical protein